MSSDFHPSSGVTPTRGPTSYSTYKSPYGPKYTVNANVAGWTLKSVSRLSGMTLGAFGGVAGFFALYFFSDVPKVRKDIWQKVPIIGQHFVKEVPASDNNLEGEFFKTDIVEETSRKVWDKCVALLTGCGYARDRP
ncbi:hypothetical protein EG329_006215 [Mollisiaceae sp. DMI_Dod_QoI]|nr:hypothetical protein EG329_006215 [Helotiales sp. DMI_Dod_QoI]